MKEPPLDKVERLLVEMKAAGQTSGWFVGKGAKATLISLQRQIGILKESINDEELEDDVLRQSYKRSLKTCKVACELIK